ncbi:MAG TPA: shikimate dehydrogenase, partial [Candidatus Omnitrophota bacterium]|nr:shikimate dehydrogenase [Candidatus Omnitrophota bacterium]
MTNKAKQLYGLIGYPVGHSFSAVMHNAAFASLGIDAEYELFEVPPQNLQDFFKKTIFERNIKGFNVTVPHKEAVIPFIDASISISAAINNAVNTVSVEADGTLSGTNTDGAGFTFDLKEKGIKVTGKKIALIGAGGGAKAVATSLAALNPAKITIFDIDPARASALNGILKKNYRNVVVEIASSLKDVKVWECEILINATPIGMKSTDPVLIEREWLNPQIFVYDLIYNPQKTELLKTAKAVG